MYTLLVLATVDPPFNPVFGGSLALVFMIVALCLLIALLYSTVNQTRPDVIIEAVHDLALAARERQRSLLRGTKPVPSYSGTVKRAVRTQEDRFVTHIDVRRIDAAALTRRIEVVLRVSIGSYVAYGDTIARVEAETPADADTMVDVVVKRIHIERQRDVRVDTAYAIAQLETIGWTSVSSAKHNPAAGLLVVQNLRDILAGRSTMRTDTAGGTMFGGVVIYQDDMLEKLRDAFESMAVASSEFRQHLIFAAIVQALAHTFERLEPEVRERVEALVLRMLPLLEDHAATREIDCSLMELSSRLGAANCLATAAAVKSAQVRRDRCLGALLPESGRRSDDA